MDDDIVLQWGFAFHLAGIWRGVTYFSNKHCTYLKLNSSLWEGWSISILLLIMMYSPSEVHLNSWSVWQGYSSLVRAELQFLVPSVPWDCQNSGLAFSAVTLKLPNALPNTRLHFLGLPCIWLLTSQILLFKSIFQCMVFFHLFYFVSVLGLSWWKLIYHRWSLQYILMKKIFLNLKLKFNWITD